MEIQFLRNDIFNIWLSERDYSKKRAHVYNYIVSNTNSQNLTDDAFKKLNSECSRICNTLKDRWLKCHRILKDFLKKNGSWLKEKVIFIIVPKTFIGVSEGKSVVGRPRKLFENSCEKSKRRKLKALIETNTSQELALAAQVSLWSTGRRDAAQIVKDITNNSPQRASKIKKSYASNGSKLPIKLSPDEALAFLIDKNMTKDQYISTRKICKDHNADIYPNYHIVLDAKKLCYPEEITITEYSAEIKLQHLLDHTIQRLILSQYDTLKQQNIDLDTTLTVIFKWGCDGASGQSKYKQNFSNETSKQNCDDAYTFMVSLVPLQLNSSCSNRNNVLWQNPKPSSPQGCRPIKIILKKETSDLTTYEIENIRSQIYDLSPTVVKFEDKEILIKQEMVLTMVDGKICSVLLNQPSQNCHVCGASPKDMNNLSLLRNKEPNKLALTLGLSSLHAWIKCFEYILHLAYRMEIQTWQVRKADKEKVQARKKIIQDRCWSEMGLLVDMPKPGFGNSNDGNSARRFFKDPALAANITGVNEELINSLGVILTTISTGRSINIEAFEKKCFDTAELCVRYYNWYYMPQSIHKLLIHGGQLIKEAPLPIGLLSEEAQEHRNKDYKRYREHHTRKCSREKSMEDILHMLLVSSDPLINSFRNKRQKKSSQLSQEVLALLENSAMNADNDEDSDYSASSDVED